MLTEIVKKHDKHVAKVLQKRDIVGSMIRDCTSFDELSALSIDVEKLSPRLVDNMPKQHDTEVNAELLPTACAATPTAPLDRAACSNNPVV